jgi:hypothetical protein
LQSIDLTDKPAANPDGLFSMKTAKFANGKDGKHHDECKCEECDGKGVGSKLEALEAKVDALMASLKPAASVASLEFQKDGKTIQLSAQDILTRLEAADKFVADAKQSVETTVRKQIITQMSSEGRVAYNPDTNVAYKLQELETMDINLLKFASKNSQVLPTVAKGTYTDTGKGPLSAPVGNDGKPLSGSALTTQMWEANYGDLDKMLQTPVGQTLN